MPVDSNTRSDSVGRDGRVWRVVKAFDRALGSPMLSLIAFAFLAQKFVYAAGFQFDEYVLVMLVYINLSHRIEETHKFAKAALLPTPPALEERRG